MKILIIEDEPIAKQKLESLLNELVPNMQLVGHLESVTEAVEWIQINESPDIAFFDIQLADSICFDIFKQVAVTFPVIFLTAFDDYVMKAFDYNAIHYILKPATRLKLKEALEKVQNFRQHFLHQSIHQLMNQPTKNYRNRLIVRKGLDAVPLKISDIAYFFSEHKISFVKATEGTSYMVDEPLSELSNQLDPHLFFRANRQYLIHFNAVKNYRSTTSSKLKLELNPPPAEDVIISKENAPHFKKWIKGA